VRTEVVSTIAGVVVGADDPSAMASRWGGVLDAPVRGDTVVLDQGVVRFEPAGSRGEGVDALELTATDRARAGEVVHAAGVELRFV
jgi:hypothetical protein